MGKALDILKSFFMSLPIAVFKFFFLDHAPRRPIPVNEEDAFSYYSRPVYQLGIRGSRIASAITPDSTIQTASGEFVILIGNFKRFIRRIWRPYKGYLPMYITEVIDGDISYKAEIFQFWNEPFGSLPVNYLRLTAINRRDSVASFRVSLGYCYKISGDHRPVKKLPFRKGPYEFSERSFRLSGKLLYQFEGDAELFERLGKRYEGPFNAERKDLIGIATFSGELEPGESRSFEFYIPHFPTEKEIKLGFNEALELFEKFWEGFLSRAMEIEVPEEKVVHVYKMSLIYNLMSQDFEASGISQKVNRFQYNAFWLRDSAFIARTLLVYNLPEIAREIISYMFTKQREDGLIISQPGQLDGIGQTLWAAGEYVEFTGDKEFAKSVLDKVRKAVLWIARNVAKDSFHVMPFTFVLDNELIFGHYTGHTIWAINGLIGAEKLAKKLGTKNSLV